MFVYFVRENPTLEYLASVGLSHICESSSDLVVRQVINGPFGTNWAVGCKLTINESFVGSFPEHQVVHEFDQFAIAIDKRVTFSPTILERRKMISGHKWTDIQGSEWLIPVARRFVDNLSTCALDRTLKVDKSGEWMFGDVIASQARLWEVATEFYNELAEKSRNSDGEVFQLPVPDFDAICSVVLGANYRVSKFEMGILNRMVVKDFYEIAKLMIDVPSVEELKKKTA